MKLQMVLKRNNPKSKYLQQQYINRVLKKNQPYLSFFLKHYLKLPLTETPATAIKIITSTIKPNSSGKRRRANKIEAINCRSCVPQRSKCF
jgi:hypothetical protein